MSKIKKLLLFFIALALVFTAGCRKKDITENKPENRETTEVSEETTETIETAEKIDFFKSGKWVSGRGIYYFFDETKGFLEHRDAPDTNTGFSYKLDKDGKAVFYTDNPESVLNADINFKKPGVIDIIWENGDTETITFDTEEIPDTITTPSP